MQSKIHLRKRKRMRAESKTAGLGGAMNKKGSDALEYLLLIAGAVLVAAIVIAASNLVACNCFLNAVTSFITPPPRRAGRHLAVSTFRAGAHPVAV